MFLKIWFAMGIVSLLLIYDLWFTDHCLSRIIEKLEKSSELVKELLSGEK